MSEEYNEHVGHETHESHGDGYLDILTDGSHLLAELTFEGTFLILTVAVNAIILRWKLRKRDEEHDH